LEEIIMEAPDTILLTLTQAEYTVLVEVLKRYMAVLVKSQVPDRVEQLAALTSIASKTLEAIRTAVQEDER
jgi:hypothetical protein